MGNICELCNVVEWLLIFSEEMVGLEDVECFVLFSIVVFGE